MKGKIVFIFIYYYYVILPFVEMISWGKWDNIKKFGLLDNLYIS